MATHDGPPRDGSSNGRSSARPLATDVLATGGLLAVCAALAFGATTPLIQRFGREAGAFPTATLLYAGAAAASLGVARAEGREPPVGMQHVPRLLAVALAGAVFAPACLSWGLQHTSGSGASLLLNLEAVFTALLAWLVHREPLGGRVTLALGAMVVAGGLLVVGDLSSATLSGGAVAVVAATIGWAVDNTLTRPLADLNPAQVVLWKGAFGASLGLVLSVCSRQRFPPRWDALALLACGATGYGASLRLYLLAQRRIGAARTGSIFALAPFVGAAIAFVMGDQAPGPRTLVAGGLFGFGVYLHLTERHHHRHTHRRLEHDHAHRHDDGHHDHDSITPTEHSHSHAHDDRTHDHSHAPDVHHEHRHR